MANKLEWYVYRQDFNSHKIEKFNVFDHGSFRNDVQRLLNGEEVYVSGDTFSEKLRHLAMYFFWSKCEHEVVITSWPPRVSQFEINQLAHNIEKRPTHVVNLEVGEKIDIYDQLMLNWDAFVKYVQEAGAND